MALGVVTDTRGFMVRARIWDSANIHRGQLLKVVSNGTRYVLRVFDFLPEVLLAREEIAALSLKRAKDQSFQLLDQPSRYYQTVLAELVAQIEGHEEPRGATTVPPILSDVEPLAGDDLEDLRLGVGDILLGTVRAGHQPTEAGLALPGYKVFPHHVLICSITGGGKTNLGKVLALNVMRQTHHKYSLLVIDTEGEYFKGSGEDLLGLAHCPHASKTLFYITERVDEPTTISLKVKYNGHQFEHRIQSFPLIVSSEELHPEDVLEVVEMTGAQEALIWLTWHKQGRNWFNHLTRSETLALLEEMNGKIKAVTIGVVKRKLQRLMGDQSMFTPGRNTTPMIPAVLEAITEGKVILVDMPNASEMQERLLTTLLARRIYSYYERKRKFEEDEWEALPPVLVLVEEAHRYLGKQRLAEAGVLHESVFSTISKRGRKYKVGLCAITQMPDELDDRVLRQQLTKIILPLPSREDYSTVIEHTPFLEHSRKEIRGLDRGEAVVVSPVSGIKFAVPVSVYRYEDLVRQQLERDILGRAARVVGV